MLSQRLHAEILLTSIGTSNQELKRQLFNEWTSEHKALLDGSEEFKINKITEEGVRNDLEDAYLHIIYIEPFISKDSLSSEQLYIINVNQLAFLAKMEDIVSDLEEFSSKKLRRIVIIEIILAVISIIVLMLEIRFIYRKVAIEQDRKLKEQSLQLDKIAWEYSHNLRAPIASLGGLSYILIHEADNLNEEDRAQILHFIEIEVGRLNEIASNTVKTSIGDELAE